MTAHHDDCDGYRFAHLAEVVRDYGAGTRPMYRAECSRCGWTGDTFGHGSERDARRQADAHTVEVRCDGRCMAWGEVSA